MGANGALLCEQDVVSVDGKDVIVSIVTEENKRWLIGREICSGNEHKVLLLDQENGIPPSLLFDQGDLIVSPQRIERELIVRSITWNLQAKPVTATCTALRKELLPLEEYDLLHVGTQECERSIAASVINQSKTKWLSVLCDAVGPKYEPLMSHTLQAIHSVLFVKRELLSSIKCVRSAAVATGLGAGETRLGNKGGVGLALTVCNKRMLFVTVHLAAHQKNTTIRDRQVAKISKEIRRILRKAAVTKQILPLPSNSFNSSTHGAKGEANNVLRATNAMTNTQALAHSKSQDSTSLGASSFSSLSTNGKTSKDAALDKERDSALSTQGQDQRGSADTSANYYNNEPVSPTLSEAASPRASASLLADFDVVIWNGDLNYRIELSRAQVDAAIQAGDLETLRAADQLSTSKKAGKVFIGYQEGPLDFLPTYKFDPHTFSTDQNDLASTSTVSSCLEQTPLDVYDSSAKQRVPSWTDRILWSCTEPQSMRLLEYRSIPNLRYSDHRPVVASWKMTTNESACLSSRKANGATFFDDDRSMQAGTESLHHQSQVCTLQ